MISFQFKQIPIIDKTLINKIKKSIIAKKISLSKLEFEGIKPDAILEHTFLVKIFEDNKLFDNAIDIANVEKIELDKYYKNITLGENLNDNFIKNEYTASLNGVCILDNGLLEIIPINNNAVYQIDISSDNLICYLHLYPGYNSSFINIEDIYHYLEKKNISSKINKELLEKSIEKLAVSKKSVRDIILTEGLAPIHGIDASLEYLVNIDSDFSPQLTEDGRVDFYNLKVFNTVEQDQEIAEYIQAKTGVDGIDIFGKIIKAKKPAILEDPQGKNTYYCKENKYILKALKSGNLQIVNDKINVNDIAQIDGNIDYGTGNLNTKSALIINGDVKNGFRVETTDSIEIKGVVEDAELIAGNNIIVKGGFNGLGKGVIRANGKVELKYVRNQKVYTRDSINITNEVIDANIYALKKILVVGGKNMAIYGGKLIAGEFIEANCLGNKYQTKTLVEAGYDYELAELLELNKIEIQTKTNLLNEIDDNLNKLYQLIHLPVEYKKVFSLLLEQRFTIFKKMVGIEENKPQLEKISQMLDKLIKQSRLNEYYVKQFYNYIDQKSSFLYFITKKNYESTELEKIIYEPTKAKIKISRYVYPGTVISINKRTFIVANEMINKTFMLSKDGSEVIFV